jgi:hypothetical protein
LRDCIQPGVVCERESSTLCVNCEEFLSVPVCRAYRRQQVLSNRPGLFNAASNVSALFVAAMQITIDSVSKPSKLGKKLVQRLFSFIISHAPHLSVAATLRDGINLVDKDD